MDSCPYYRHILRNLDPSHTKSYMSGMKDRLCGIVGIESSSYLPNGI